MVPITPEIFMINRPRLDRLFDLNDAIAGMRYKCPTNVIGISNRPKPQLPPPDAMMV